MVVIHNGKVIYEQSYDSYAIFNFFILLAVIYDDYLLDLAISQDPDEIFASLRRYNEKLENWARKLGDLKFYKIYSNKNLIIYYVRTSKNLQISNKSNMYSLTTNEFLLPSVIYDDGIMRTYLFPSLYIDLAYSIINHNRKRYEELMNLLEGNMLFVTSDYIHFSDFYGDYIIKIRKPYSFTHWVSHHLSITFKEDLINKVFRKITSIYKGEKIYTTLFSEGDIPLIFHVALDLYRKQYFMLQSMGPEVYFTH